MPTNEMWKRAQPSDNEGYDYSSKIILKTMTYFSIKIKMSLISINWEKPDKNKLNQRLIFNPFWAKPND
jgi:hypothetical protein